MSKIYTTSYRLAMLNVHNEPLQTKCNTYKRLLLELCNEIKEKGHQLI